MNVINGFVTKADRINNNKGVVNRFFALSPIALTYAKDYSEYQNATFPLNTLYTFTALDEQGNELILPVEDVYKLMTVVETALAAIASSPLPYNKQLINQAVLVAHPSFLQDFTYGTIYSDQFERNPDWVSFKAILSTGLTDVRLWLMNEVFLTQYPGYEIVVIPPVDNVDLLLGNYADVKVLIENTPVQTLQDKTQDAIGNYPATKTRVLTFKLYNRQNPSQYTNVDWYLAIYGQAGDNVDAQKDAILDYLTQHSTRPVTDWQQVFPEIFKRTEFIFYPRWDAVAIENSNTDARIYQSIFSPKTMVDYVVSRNPHGQLEPEVMGKLEALPFDFKCVIAGVMPGETNTQDIDSLSKVVPDYLPLSTSELDFGRMSVETQQWVNRIVGALAAAETVTAFSTLMMPYRRVFRSDKLYISFTWKNVNYLVDARANGGAL